MTLVLPDSELDSHPFRPFPLLLQNTVTWTAIQTLCRHEVKYQGEAVAGRPEKGEESGSKQLGAHLLQNNYFLCKELNFGEEKEIKV